MSERYPPLADYGFISDCHTAAFVSRAGSVDWMCVPRFDSGSCFGRMLDWDSGGHCTVAPRLDRFDCSRRYLDGSARLRLLRPRRLVRFRSAALRAVGEIGEQRLLPTVRELPRETLAIADGFSCKTQIEQLTGRRALQAQLLELALAGRDGELSRAARSPRRQRPRLPRRALMLRGGC